MFGKPRNVEPAQVLVPQSELIERSRLLERVALAQGEPDLVAQGRTTKTLHIAQPKPKLQQALKATKSNAVTAAVADTLVLENKRAWPWSKADPTPRVTQANKDVQKVTHALQAFTKAVEKYIRGEVSAQDFRTHVVSAADLHITTEAITFCDRLHLNAFKIALREAAGAFEKAGPDFVATLSNDLSPVASTQLRHSWSKLLTAVTDGLT